MRTNKYYSVNGVNLYTEIIGEGYPIFFLHGGPGATLVTFSDYLDDLSNDFKLIYYDQRNHGLSSKEDPKTLTMDYMVDDLMYLAGELGYEKYAVCGHSWGGRTFWPSQLSFVPLWTKL